MIINLPLTTRPGQPNINGITYSQEEYDKMINGKHFQFLKKHDMLYVTNGIDILRKTMNIDFIESSTVNFTDIVGRVVELKDDNTADVLLLNPDFEKAVKENANELVLSMFYMGEVEAGRHVKDMRIIHYYLQMKVGKDKNCPHHDICEEMHGSEGEFGYIDCPGCKNCLEPYNSYYDGLEANEKG